MNVIAAVETYCRNLVMPGYVLGFELGRSYAKVWKASGGSRSVVCFVELSSGSIFGAKSWKAANTRHLQGNVFAL